VKCGSLASAGVSIVHHRDAAVWAVPMLDRTAPLLLAVQLQCAERVAGYE
jgi:hypothetical protein